MTNDQGLSRRYGWIDLCRGLFMFLIFLYHSTTYYHSGVDYRQYAWLFTPIYLSGFFFISGYLFTNTWEQVSVRRKWMQVVRSILIPYFLFMAAFFFPKLVFLDYGWKDTLMNILLLRESWFVIALGILQMLYALTMRYCKKLPAFLAVSAIYASIGYGFIYFYCDLPEWFVGNPLLYSAARPACMPACINLAFKFVPFFVMGILYRKFEGKLKLKGNILPGLLLLAVYLVMVFWSHDLSERVPAYADSIGFDYCMNLILFLFVMPALLFLSKKVVAIGPLNYIGRHSLLFYYLNILMLRITDKALHLLDFDMPQYAAFRESLGYGNYILVSLIAVAATFPVVGLINKYLPLLTGKKEAYVRLCRKLNLRINW